MVTIDFSVEKEVIKNSIIAVSIFLGLVIISILIPVVIFNIF